MHLPSIHRLIDSLITSEREISRVILHVLDDLLDIGFHPLNFLVLFWQESWLLLQLMIALVGVSAFFLCRL